MAKFYSRLLRYSFLVSVITSCVTLSAQTTQTFSYTGSMQSFTVPTCVTSITVDVRGSKGGDCIYNQPGTKPDDLGGLGGRVVAVYTVTPGQVLNIFVGGISYNGGGNGAGSVAQANGGGASDIRIGGVTLTDRVIVAGGGGGGGNNCSANAEPGGDGGGLTGATGWQCGNQTGTAVGQGGTQSAGGAAGTSPATAGLLGIGGNAGGAGTASGGGGGGYYGGGGAAYGGGGGGSSYTNASATSVVHTQGFNNGTGLVILSYGPSPVAVNSTSLNVCSGSTATLSTISLQTYTWSNGAITATTQVSPTVTTTYSIQGTNLSGCPVTGMISIGVISSPTLAVSATSSSICTGNSATLTASGSASTYSWNTGANTASISVSPAATTNYSVTGANSCGTASAVTSVSVTAAPVVTLPTSTIVCGSGSVILTAGGNASSYSWNTGATTASISVSPTVTTNYTVAGTGSCGTASAVTTVSLGTLPTVTAMSSATIICSNNAVVLTASGNGGASYTWNTGATTTSISVSPSVTTVYTVTATNSCGTATASITQSVTTCTGLKELLSSQEIHIYPNPANDIINVAISSSLISGNTRVEIVDAIGKLVLKESLNKDVTILKLNDLENGVYFFKIISNDYIIKIGKVIKQ
ncbi:MAG: glycine-rich protein [Bacteroidota bacterium]